MKTKLILLHGPNLNLLGEREADTYGHESSEQILDKLRNNFQNVEIDYFQSNNESELIDKIQLAGKLQKGILINPGAYSHTSIAIADAIRSISIPCICVHISNIYQREEYRHTDIVGDACLGAIVGLGTDGYSLALECLLDEIAK